MQDSTAQVIPIGIAKQDGYPQLPVLHDRVAGNARAIFVKKLRDIADAIERGEFDGARAQWLDTHGMLVEVGDKTYNLVTQTPPPGEQVAISGMEVLTRTAWTEDGSGEVALKCTTVVEEG